ncbi:hypothetical protein NDA12_003756 [Ustilago hordei]|nr:hypothetical protein NDA12_003756 [Ustilago hordei]
MSYYAVLNGFVPGIYTSWQDCRPEVTGYSRAFFRKFYRYSDAYDFLYDNRIIVYVDGSAINNGYANARAGYGVWFQNPDLRYLNQQCRLSGDIQSNNRAELTAIIIALEIAPEDGRKLIICSDSQYAMNTLFTSSPNPSITQSKSKVMRYYVVVNGRQPGVYDSWTECEAQIKDWPGAVYKRFYSRRLAERFLYSNVIVACRWTSNRGELFAILNACQLARKDQRQLVVFTDCRYALKPVLERMPLWQSKGWRNNKGKKVADHLAKQGADLDPKISARGSEEITQAALLPELHDLFRQLTISAKRA